ncbi:MAG: bacteriorhodopsin [Neolewinella sp.]|jgi:bacteriorhodopsin
MAIVLRTYVRIPILTPQQLFQNAAMPTLTPTEFSLVYNVMSLCIAAMFAGALFFFFSRSQVAPKYRPALLISALVPTIACYHYFRIAHSFDASYMLVDGNYVASGELFNDAYRYADWLLTVPLLVIELVAVLGLAKMASRSMSMRLSIAAALMIVLGYPGEVATEASGKWLWWVLSMIPFLFIMFTLFTKFGSAVNSQPSSVQPIIKKARGLILITWSFYPIAYLATVLGLSDAAGQVTLQVGYTIADITSKVGLGIYIYFIAREKSDADGYVVGSDGSEASSKAA